MPPVAARSCGQAVRRQILSASEGVWITDALLSRAFERYCARSPAARRLVSCVPGPLEARRRLGKRHMTELYSFQSAAPLPPWAFEAPPDLGSWNWRAPASAGHQEPAVPPFGETKSWPKILLGSFIGDAALPEQHDTLALGTRVEPKHTSLWDLDDMISRIRHTKLKTVQGDLISFIDRVREDAEKGRVTTDDLYRLLVAIPEELFLRHGKSPRAAHLVSCLCQALCGIIGSSDALRADNFEYRFWSSLIERVASLDGKGPACSLFKQVMVLVPTNLLDHLDDAVTNAVVSLFKYYTPPRLAGVVGKPTASKPGQRGLSPPQRPVIPLSRQAALIARGLSRYSGETHRPLLARIGDSILDSVGNDAKRLMGVVWLSVLARMPSVDKEHLTKVTRIHFPSGGRLMTIDDKEICEVLILHWASQGYVPNTPEFRHWAENRQHLPADSETALAHFVHQICRKLPAESRAASLASLCKFLRRLGRLRSLVSSFEALCQGTSGLSARPMALAAVACKDHRLALDLHRIARAHAGKFSGARDVELWWDWRLWYKYMDALIEDETLGPRPLRQLLEIDPRWKRVEATTEPALPAAELRRQLPPPVPRKTLHMVERSAHHIVMRMTRTADGSLDRVALHLVQSRIKYLESRGIKLRPKMLQTITHLLTRDLARGELGRKTRLRWLLNLIAKHEGPEAAQAAGLALSRWRELNHAAYKEREGAEEGARRRGS